MTVPGMAARVSRYGAQALEPRRVPHVVHERPGAIERRRPEVIRIPLHHVARRVAHAAADALDAGVGELARRRARRHRHEIILLRLPPAKLALRARPLAEELAHVDHQVADHRQVAQGPNLALFALYDLVYVRAAGPARHVVHHHRARAAHAHAAGIAIRERRIEHSLDVGDDIQHRLAGMPRYLELLVGRAALDPNLQADSYSRVSTNSRWPSASAAVRRPLAVRNMHSSSLSPAWSGVSSLRRRPETSTSMCSDIVRTVRGFAQSLITGRIGLPMTLPCPVGKKCTAYPAAAHSVTISAAAEDESMNHRPGPVGISALSSTPSTTHLRPIFWMLPSAFSSMVVSPPAMLPLVGCESDRSLVLWRLMMSW